MSLQIILIAGFLLKGVCLWGQFDQGLDPDRHIAFLQSIKQLNEFVERFNQNEYEVPGSEPGQTLILDRKQSILLLFDRNDPRFNRTDSSYSDEYISLVLGFAEEISTKKIYLERYTNQIVAVVSARVQYFGIADTMQILLVRETSGPGLVRWVISGVEADFLQVQERDTSQVRFLSPVSHELGFMDLKKALNEPENILDYTRKDFDFNPLHAFLLAVSREDLQVDEIFDITYRIHVEPDYLIYLEQKVRDFGIPGWYVLNLEKTSSISQK